MRRHKKLNLKKNFNQVKSNKWKGKTEHNYSTNNLEQNNLERALSKGKFYVGSFLCLN